MDFKATFTSAPRRAFTLVEILIAAAIGTMAMGALLSSSVFSSKSFVAMTNYQDMDNKSRNALDRMSREIRGMEGVGSFSTAAYANPAYSTSSSITNSVSFIPYFGAPNSEWVTFTYDPAGRTLSRISNSVSETYLTECDYLNFGLFQRNQVAGAFLPLPTSTPSLVKLVQIDWVCSREIMGMKMNTESVQSARFVIRRQ